MSHENRSKRAPCHRPDVEEIQKAQERARLTDAQCAELVCVPEVTWYRWAAGAFPMPPGAWKLFRYEVGMLELQRRPEKWRKYDSTSDPGPDLGS